MPLIPERLTQFRKSKKLTHEEMADFLGITRQGYGHYENGKREPDQETMDKLADFFETSIDYLQGRTEDPSPVNSQENRSVDEQLAEIIRNNPDVGMFFKDFAGAPEQRKKEMLRFWRMLELEEKDRKPGDKQGE